MIKDALADFEDHLKSIDEKLESTFSRAAGESDEDAIQMRQMQGERSSTQQGLAMCAQLSTHISRIQPLLAGNRGQRSDIPKDHPDRASWLNNLGNGLGRRFEQTGSLDDLNHAVDAANIAVDATPQGHHNRTAYFNRLSVAEATYERALPGYDDREETRNHANLSNFGTTNDEGEDEEQQAGEDEGQRPAAEEQQADEVEEQHVYEVEIQSFFSNPGPSLTTGSTISSSLAPGLLEDIKSDILTILIKDEELRGLLKETPGRITHERFQSNFLRLFRLFLSDIRKQSHNGGQELRQVIRILMYQSRNIASHICQEIFDLKAQLEALQALALQVPDTDGQLIRFFENDRYGRISPPNLHFGIYAVNQI
jgi:hypothetical protein